MINARAETVATMSCFGRLLKWRCVIPADGFYEWRREGKAKKPFLIHARRPAARAGPWARGATRRPVIDVVSIGRHDGRFRGRSCTTACRRFPARMSGLFGLTRW